MIRPRKPTALTFILILALAASVAGAVTWTVDDDGPADFSSIQSAIVGASNGDTILVKRGRYRETVNFLNKSLTVVSEEGPRNTIVFLEGETRIMLLNGDSTLRGFTIRGGRARIGGGIYVTDGAQAVIEDNIIENNVAEWNGVLPGFGGGIAVDLASNPVITRNVIRGNQALGDATGAYGYGGGIDLGDYTAGTITNNVIVDNEASDSGGGVSVGLLDSNDSVLITNNTIIDNRAGADGDGVTSLGGGVLLEDGFNGDVRNNLFDGNRADSGGGIYFFGNGVQGINYQNNNFNANVPDHCFGLSGSKCDTDQFFLAPGLLDRSVDPRLRSDSPLIDLATPTGAPLLDRDGRTRPADGDLDGAAVPDIGAYENPREITGLVFTAVDTLQWHASANPAATYDVYRDGLVALAPGPIGVCLQSGVGTNAFSDASTPASDGGFFYLVAARAAAAGSIGFDSAGFERTPLAPCP